MKKILSQKLLFTTVPAVCLGINRLPYSEKSGLNYHSRLSVDGSGRSVLQSHDGSQPTLANRLYRPAARSRYILAWELCPGMQAVDVERTVQAALKASSLTTDQRPRMLSDNGSAYVSRYLKEYLKGESIEHIRSAPFHPMTQGKIER
jgi:transposase InsO family protein